MVYIYTNEDPEKLGLPTEPAEAARPDRDNQFIFRPLTEDLEGIATDKENVMQIMRLPKVLHPDFSCFLLYSFFDDADYFRVMEMPFVNERVMDIGGLFPIFTYGLQNENRDHPFSFNMRIPYLLVPSFIREAISGHDKDASIVKRAHEKPISEDPFSKFVNRPLPSKLFDFSEPSIISRTRMTVRNLVYIISQGINIAGIASIKKVAFDLTLSLDPTLQRAAQKLVQGGDQKAVSLVAEVTVRANTNRGEELSDFELVEKVLTPMPSGDSAERDSELRKNAALIQRITNREIQYAEDKLTDPELQGEP